MQYVYQLTISSNDDTIIDISVISMLIFIDIVSYKRRSIVYVSITVAIRHLSLDFGQNFMAKLLILMIFRKVVNRSSYLLELKVMKKRTSRCFRQRINHPLGPALFPQL